jgi:hypothetical protein
MMHVTSFKFLPAPFLSFMEFFYLCLGVSFRMMAYALQKIVYNTVYNCCQFENFQITGCHCSNIKAVQDEGTGSLSH